MDQYEALKKVWENDKAFFEKRIADLRTENERLKREFDEYRDKKISEAAEAHDYDAQQNAEVDSLMAERGELRAENELLRESLSGLRLGKASQTVQLQIKDAQLVAAEYRYGQLEHDFNKLRAENERLKEDVDVGLSISGSFFEALKPLNLAMINVGNPGSHVTDLITECDQLRAEKNKEIERLRFINRQQEGEIGVGEQKIIELKELLEASIADTSDFANQAEEMRALKAKLADMTRIAERNHRANLMPCPKCGYAQATIRAAMKEGMP